MAKNNMPDQKPKVNPKLWAHGGLDIWFLALVLIILTIGLIMMFSASYTYCYYHFDGDSFYYIKRQLFFAVFGVVAMFFVSKVHYNFYKQVTKIVLFISYALLGLVLILPPPSGYEQFHRWIQIPGLGTFQPSEIAKFAVILFLAAHISDNYRGINNKELTQFRGVEIPTKYYCLGIYLALIGSTCMFVYLENHVSGTLLILLLGIVMLWFAGFDSRFFIIAAGLIVFAAIVVIAKPDILPAHAQPRILAWLDKDYDPLGARWQTNNALYAIGSGGLFGVGLGNSTQKQLYVSEPQNDFIFSIVCEELGVVGAGIIIILFILLVWRGFYIGMHIKEKFPSLLAMGISFQVGLQAAINIAVVTDVLPNTGISLPFFSYGGTSLLMLLGEMGIVLGVSRYANFKKV